MLRRPGGRAARRMIRRTRRRMIRRTVLVGGMVVLAASSTAAAMKLSQDDAQRIEESTGLPPEQLEDEDLYQAMQELDIQPQPVSADEQAALGQQSVPPAQPAAAEPTAGNQPNYFDELTKLAELRDLGIITQDEFTAKKKQLLGL